MSHIKITATFADGQRRVLREPDTLPTIDGRRLAYFVLDNGKVYKGQTDGVVDAAGNFFLKTDRAAIFGMLGINLPLGRLVGWAYVNSKRRKADIERSERAKEEGGAQ